MVEPERDERQRFVSDLKSVRRRAIWRIEDPKRPKLDISVLANAAIQHAETESSLAAAVEHLLRAAITLLPEGLIRNTALGIYGLDCDPGDGKPTDWRNRVFRMFYFHLARNTYEDDIEPSIIGLIAAQIQAIMYSRAPADSLDLVDGTATWSSIAEAEKIPYIQRPKLDSLLAGAANLASGGNRRIFVSGDAGTGKSAFTRNALLRSKISRVIWLNASTEDRLYDAIARFISSAGLKITECDKITLRFSFAQYLREQNDWQTVVVVDDYDDPDFIYDLIPADAPCVGIVTSRLLPSDPDWPRVVVDDMNDDEATAMVHALLPGLDKLHARGLATALGYRPRLIENACSYMAREPSISAMDLTQIFATNTVEALEAISPRTMDHLAVLYRHLIRELEREHPNSLRILEFLVFASAQYMPKEYLGSFLLGRPCLTFNDAQLAHIKLRAALQPLIENCVVKDGPGMVMMPFLVQAVLQSLLRDRLSSVADAAIHLRANRGQLYRAGWTLGSVASRFTCESILKARIEDQHTNQIGAFLATPSGSARWIALVAEAWGRMLAMEALLLKFMADAALGSSVMESLSFKAFSPMHYDEARIAVRRAPQLIREDIELSINISRALVEVGREAGLDLENVSDVERKRLIMVSIGGLFERYAISPDGQVDTSILLDWVSDSGAENFHSVMRDLFPEAQSADRQE